MKNNHMSYTSSSRCQFCSYFYLLWVFLLIFWLFLHLNEKFVVWLFFKPIKKERSHKSCMSSLKFNRSCSAWKNSCSSKPLCSSSGQVAFYSSWDEVSQLRIERDKVYAKTKQQALICPLKKPKVLLLFPLVAKHSLTHTVYKMYPR